MHIALFTSEFPPGPGGIGNHAYALAMDFAGRGIPVSIITISRSLFNHDAFDKDQPFEIVRYKTDSSALCKIFVHLKFLWHWRKRITHVLLSGSSQQMLTICIRLLSDAKVINVLHGHEVLMAKGLRKWLLKESLRLGSRIIVVSDFSKHLLIKNGFNFPVNVIPNGVHAKRNDKLTSFLKTTPPLKLITVGSITPRKGQHNVIRAIPFIRRLLGPVEYHLVGIPEYRSFLEKRIKELGINEGIFIHGVLTDCERDSLLRSSHVFMMLSENQPNGDVEGFGIAVLEANALGVPAIGSSGTGLEQSIKPGLNGLLVNPHDPKAIANSVKVIIDQYDDYSANSRRWAMEHDWGIIAQKYWELLAV
ncbi:MAG: glycosyltransferase family 4 protein [Cyclobacteriaceae bacterium]|nr:glycosyltransferase family 4 protein [Cyclobacteriaceae bacterium]